MFDMKISEVMLRYKIYELMSTLQKKGTRHKT